MKIKDTENCHWRNSTWFLINRGISRHTLIGMEEAGDVRSCKGDAKDAIHGARLWCVEDYDKATAINGKFTGHPGNEVLR